MRTHSFIERKKNQQNVFNIHRSTLFWIQNVKRQTQNWNNINNNNDDDNQILRMKQMKRKKIWHPFKKFIIWSVFRAAATAISSLDIQSMRSQSETMRNQVIIMYLLRFTPSIHFFYLPQNKYYTVQQVILFSCIPFVKFKEIIKGEQRLNSD